MWETLPLHHVGRIEVNGAAQPRLRPPRSSGPSSGTAWWLDLDLASLVQGACAIANRDLIRDE